MKRRVTFTLSALYTALVPFAISWMFAKSVHGLFKAPLLTGPGSPWLEFIRS